MRLLEFILMKMYRKQFQVERGSTRTRDQQINIMLFVHQMYKFDRSFGEKQNWRMKFENFDCFMKDDGEEGEWKKKRNRMMTIETAVPNKEKERERV